MKKVSTKLERVFPRAEDKLTRSFVVYGKSSDSKLYYESAYTTQVSQADLEAAFALGLVHVVDGSTTYLAVSIAANKVKTVGLVSSAVTLTEWTAKATA